MSRGGAGAWAAESLPQHSGLEKQCREQSVQHFATAQRSGETGQRAVCAAFPSSISEVDQNTRPLVWIPALYPLADSN